MNRIRKSGGFKASIFVIVVALILYVAVYMPTPYIIYLPGSADEIKPMVTVKGGDKEENGVFMMTTVSATYANVFLLGTSLFNRNAQIDKKEDRLRGKSEAEYSAEQVWFMSDSQSSAMEAAYEKAGIKYSIVPEHIFVFGLSQDPKPQGDIMPGDTILGVDGTATPDNTILSAQLKGRKPGDTVEMQLERGGETISREVQLVEVTDNKTGEKRPGLGVMIGTVQKVKPEDPDKQITFTSTQVGGPSAGLMFTLEIYNQLTSGDLTKGHRIAGTGTITKDGTVGPIGGVIHKIVAADRKDAEIFFVPKDNYKEAEAKAKQIDTKMKLVPVSNVDDALAYLKTLSVKS
ncbi:PDZ domain-containing protein [Paenibacillus sp. ACRSA]|uniref:SepM family pheromone-processing serine protease n=1 Tax=Paenibacillus sp. ACRSA TaxID=2918211 RepID=UPI001EF4F3ED|nr:SepM family pheromone-processing serine protease [Paenibacillus sp. ACRSA]MCG7376981.1 PDZ domain-containing protein [Paenibacillus sp. ACRSA]